MESGKKIQPRSPKQVSDYAEACFQALVAQGLGHTISLGGAFGLAHYFEYRPTRDVDAWWTPEATSIERARVVHTIQEALQVRGQVHTRAWGDVVSVELFQEEHEVFSFQIAQRSAQLEPSQPSPWTGVLLDSFSDLLASKVVALVERGAPRDFRDIYTLCRVRMVTPQECWALWRRRQKLAGGDANAHRARLAVETHLARIEQHRPLPEIADPTERTEAARVRAWFKTTFLDALLGGET